ncbi:MAG: hypothetical protein E7447_02340 [Ruminococcaceae bacterium]|nr:hypothetical protein [Oscillospiraceae bacterium]
MEELLSVIALVISVISGLFATYTFFWTARRDRQQATLEAYNQLQEQALDHLNYYMPAAIKEIAQNPRSEEYKKISSYVARIEHFCVGVNQKIYDKKTVYELAQDYLDGAIKDRIEPIIEKKNRHTNEDYYENIHKVYKWMAEQKAKEEGKGK